MSVVEGHGLRVGYRDGADHMGVRLAAQTLDRIRLTCPRGRPEHRPEKWSRTADMLAARFAVYFEGVVAA
jgi:hypothetical protein